MKRDLVPVSKIRDEFPWWPYKADGTYRLISLGRLDCVRVGRNIYVTEEILRGFVDKHDERNREERAEMPAFAIDPFNLRVAIRMIVREEIAVAVEEIRLYERRAVRREKKQ